MFLQLAVETIKSHRKNILMKTGSKNMVEACCDALRKGWIE